MSHGVIAKEGSLIDASFVDVPRQRNSREENACIKKGEIPASFEKEDIKLHADSAYRSEKIETYLKGIESESFVHKKGYRNSPLTEEQKLSNKAKSKVRARVEHIFCFMTNSMHNALWAPLKTLCMQIK
ncbi:MAG: hypothetical protein ACI8TE_001041 [Francisella sp.]|jgi:hypothetical protein